MSKAEEVNRLENEISSLSQSLQNASPSMKKTLMKEINSLKNQIEVIIREVVNEETFFDKFD